MAFWDSIWTKFKQKQIGCVELHIKEDNSSFFNFVMIRLEKDKLNFDKVKTGIETFDELKQEVGRNLPIILVLTGKGVIQKKVNNSGSENKIDQLRKVFPNAKPADFYTSIIDLGNDQELIGVTRKEQADKLIHNFTTDKYSVVDLFIGAGVVFSIQNAIKSLPHHINITNCVLDLVQKEITQTNTMEDIIEIGDEKISSYSLPGLAAGYNYLVEHGGEYIGDISIIQESSVEFIYRQKFRMAGLSMIIIFFLILLVNFFIFDHYNSKYNHLSSNLTEYQGFLNNYKTLKKELDDKKLLLNETGILEPSKVSYYADRIAADIPKGIQLDKMEINPVIRKRSNEKQLKFTNGLIIISGKANRSTVFNDWLNVLGEYEWVKKVGKFTYNKQDESRNEPAEFNIELEYK
ncbi:MAG: hypothetical protein K8R68_06160 [Bacteroidales bacterium]|nr:hypothetical protein [Bacteroidales bacterium]